MTRAQFRVHLSIEVDGKMLRHPVDVFATSADDARKKVIGQKAFKGAIVLKTKKVRE